MENHTFVDILDSTNCEKALKGDTAFVLTNSVILMFMIPGFSLFYSGQTNIGSSVTTMVALPFLSIVVITFQWWLIGYSLAFSKTGSKFIGDFSNVLLQGVLNCNYPEAPRIPEVVFSLYQCITAMIPPVIFLGAITERGRIIPAAIFLLLWTTFVYDVICCWSLNPNGWSYQMGLLDYGGASPVHVPAGMTALAYSMILYRSPKRPCFHPKIRSANQVVLGMVLIWFASFGNMSGAAMDVNTSGIFAAVAVVLAGSSGAITWSVLECCLQKNESSVIGFCNGALVGLAAITPCAGFVSTGSSVCVGIVAAVACYLACRLKEKFEFNDVLEVFVLHGVSGAVGSILTGILSQGFYGRDLVNKNGGWLDGNWIQVPIQILDVIATGVWSFVVSYIILSSFNKIPFLKLEVPEEVVVTGLDKFEVRDESFERIVFNTFNSELVEKTQLTSVSSIEKFPKI